MINYLLNLQINFGKIFRLEIKLILQQWVNSICKLLSKKYLFNLKITIKKLLIGLKLILGFINLVSIFEKLALHFFSHNLIIIFAKYTKLTGG